MKKNLITSLIFFFVYNFSFSQTNLALGKTTIQSSTYSSLISNIAVDGNTNGDSHTHTTKEVNAYWRVDLGNNYAIQKIKIFNRSASAQWVIDRLIGFKLFIGNSNSTNPADYTEISTLNGSGEQIFDNINVTGRYVMIHSLNKEEFLSLAEVEVYNSTSNNNNNSTSLWSQSGNNISYTNGNVGIGTSNPSEILELRQKENLNKGLIISQPNNSQKIYLHLADNSSGEYGYFHLGGNTKLRGNGFNSSFEGALGIGTTNPGSWKLAVNGKIRAKEIKVETGWSDFVFYDDYKLPTLKQVEEHIKEKGHLKDIPSAVAVAKNGIFLGEMDAKLLQKIEELTLYTIDQEKRIVNQDSKLEKQAKEIEKLKALVTQLLEADK